MLRTFLTDTLGIMSIATMVYVLPFIAYGLQ